MAEEKVKKGVSQYITHFNADVFLNEITFSESAAFQELFQILGTLHHEVFSALQPGERLLDVGSGPGIRNVVSSSSKFQNVTLSDPVPQNRHMLQKYVDDVTEDRKWVNYFRLTAELEGDVEKWPEVRERMRARIKQVVWCDITQDEPLGNDQPQELYDCVMTTLCLCAASSDKATYARVVKNLVSLVKPGGHVIIADVLACDHYVVGDVKFSNLPVTEEEMYECVRAAGCEVLSFMKKERKNVTPNANGKWFCILAARKM